MRAHLHTWARWLRLVLACLAVGAAVSPAQVASAAEPVGVVQGGPGKKPTHQPRATVAPLELEVDALLEAERSALSRSVRATIPRASGQPLFLLHRALLR